MTYDPNLPTGLPSDFNDEPPTKECPTCKGTGKIEDYGEGTECPSCEGHGVVEANFRTIKDAIENDNEPDNTVE